MDGNNVFPNGLDSGLSCITPLFIRHLCLPVPARKPCLPQKDDWLFLPSGNSPNDVMVSRVSFQEQWKKRRMRKGRLFYSSHAPADAGCSGFSSSRANPVFIPLGAYWHKKSRTKSGFFVSGVFRRSLSRRVRRHSPSSRFATRHRGSRDVCSGSGGSRRVPTRRSRGWACPGQRRYPSAGCPGSGCW